MLGMSIFTPYTEAIDAQHEDLKAFQEGGACSCAFFACGTACCGVLPCHCCTAQKWYPDCCACNCLGMICCDGFSCPCTAMKDMTLPVLPAKAAPAAAVSVKKAPAKTMADAKKNKASDKAIAAKAAAEATPAARGLTRSLSAAVLHLPVVKAEGAFAAASTLLDVAAMEAANARLKEARAAYDSAGLLPSDMPPGLDAAMTSAGGGKDGGEEAARTWLAGLLLPHLRLLLGKDDVDAAVLCARTVHDECGDARVRRSGGGGEGGRAGGTAGAEAVSLLKQHMQVLVGRKQTDAALVLAAAIKTFVVAPESCLQSGPDRLPPSPAAAAAVSAPAPAPASSSSSSSLLASVIRTHVFLTHNWANDKLGRNNHGRVLRVNRALQTRGFVTWFDEDRMVGNVRRMMTDGIDHTQCMIVFVTSVYRDKVNGSEERDNCHYEYSYSVEQLGPQKMIPVVMEPSMKAPGEWKGALGAALATKLYIDLSDDIVEGPAFEAKMDQLCAAIVAIVGDVRQAP